MTPSPPETTAPTQWTFLRGLVVAMVTGGILFAVIDLYSFQRGMNLAYDFASAFGSLKEEPKVSVTWFYGAVSIGEVRQPRVWAAAGGLIMGAAYGAVCFLIIRAIVRAIRKVKSSP